MIVVQPENDEQGKERKYYVMQSGTYVKLTEKHGIRNQEKVCNEPAENSKRVRES